MKDKPNEWVAISDLMSGVMAVVLLLLVVSVLQSAYAQLVHEQEKQQSISTKEMRLTSMMSSLAGTFKATDTDDILSVDISARKIILKDSVFSRGSACVTDKATTSLQIVEQEITEFLRDFEGGKVVIEGHTDNVAVSRPVTDFVRFCAVYDDNYTLSAARAREARKLVIGSLSEQESKQIIVAGYGDSQPIPGLESSDGANRRVELIFTLNESLD